MESETSITQEDPTAAQPPISLAHRLPSENQLVLINDGKSLSAPLPQQGINHLVFNGILPGLGSFVRGRRSLAVSQMLVFFVSVPLFFYSVAIALPLLLFAYAWSIWTGVQFVKEPKEWA